jgi:ring-1,2-phenylacetyl-CoA epoxidase subunit PaaD
MPLDESQVWEILTSVADPEIPVVSVVEMGIVRQVAVDGRRVEIIMTPTFTGCPALDVMQEDMRQALWKAGAQEVKITITHNPPWTSDWISPEARQKLKEFGLAPPPQHQGLLEAALLEPVSCPYCGSGDTSLKNPFGPTLCRAIFYCNACQQPFEQFKPL